MNALNGMSSPGRYRLHRAGLHRKSLLKGIGRDGGVVFGLELFIFSFDLLYLARLGNVLTISARCASCDVL